MSIERRCAYDMRGKDLTLKNTAWKREWRLYQKQHNVKKGTKLPAYAIKLTHHHNDQTIIKCWILLVAFIGRGANRPRVQILSKDHAFSSLKHGLHVLDRAHYWMIVPNVFPWIFKQYVIRFFLMINFQVNQMCRFQQK
jgi:hypothetical protein